MFENLKIIDKIPDEIWLSRVRKNNYLWLVKEKTFGVVEWEYEGEVGYSSGRIGFRMHKNGAWVDQTWMVRPNGQGINYSQLFLPVEGHLSDNPPDLEAPELRKLHRQVSLLAHRLELLERGLWLADSLTGLQPQRPFPKRR